MSTSKINIQIGGVKLTLPATTLTKTNFKGEAVTPYLDLRGKHVASLVKQYVKIKYPQIECSVNSASFAGGNSVDIYVSTGDGYEVSDVIEADINSFAKEFQYGYFNGMDDMYEYNQNSIKTDNNTRIEGGVKYVSVNNRPQFGTVADVCRMLRDYQAGNYIGGVRDLEGSIKGILSYGIPQKNVDKALELI